MRRVGTRKRPRIPSIYGILMPVLTADQRVAFVQSLWDQFQRVHKVTRWHMNHLEYDMARKWAVRGVPLATVLQGINETSGKPRTLMACERSVEDQISRWASAVGSLRELPAPGPLEDEPFDVEAARERRDEALAAMRGGTR